MGYLTNLAPFQYDKKLSDGGNSFVGLSNVICESVRESTGMEFIYIPFTNYKDMINAVSAGDIDIVAGMTGNEKGANGLTLSKSYLELSNVIIKDESLELDNLNNKKEGIIKGNELEEEYLSSTIKVEFDSMADLVKAIEKKKVDFALSNYYTANYYIKDGDYHYVSIVPLTQKTGYSLAFAKYVDTRLLSICNKCIYSFPEERIQMILMKYMDPQAKKITLKRYVIANPIQSTLVISGLVLFVVGVILIRNKEKQKHLKKHQMDLKRYEVLSQLTDEYVFEYDFETNTIHFDDKFSKKFGFNTKINLDEERIGNDELIKFINEIIDAKEKENFYKSWCCI